MELQFIAVPIACHNLDENNVLVVNRLSKQRFLFDKRIASFLEAATQPRSIEEHVAAFATTDTHHESVIVVRNLLSQQLLRPIHELLAYSNDTGMNSDPIQMLIVTTRDRPNHLRRLLDSISSFAHFGDRKIKGIVLDDSRNFSASNFLNSRSVTSDNTWQYRNREWRWKAASEFGRHTRVQESLLQTAFGTHDDSRRSEASNRNLGLLEARGTRAILLDDDLVFAPQGFLHRGGPIDVSHAINHMEIRFYLDRASALEDDGNFECCPCFNSISMYDQVLGLPPALWRSNSLRVTKIKSSDKFWHNLVARRGIVQMAIPGLRGESGRSMRSWIMSRGASKMQISNEYALARRSRFIREYSKSTLISDTSFCMTYALGLDHRALLPPFIPVARNTDGVFGVLCRIMYPNNYTAFLPITFWHDTGEDQSPICESRVWRDTGIIRDCDIFISLIKQSAKKFSNHQPASRLTSVGSSFVTWGQMPRRIFSAVIIDTISKIFRTRLAQHERALARTDLLPDVAEDLRKACLIIRQRQQESVQVINMGVYTIKVDENGISELQRSVLEVGRLLEAWPSIWNLWPNSTIMRDL